MALGRAAACRRWLMLGSGFLGVLLLAGCQPEMGTTGDIEFNSKAISAVTKRKEPTDAPVVAGTPETHTLKAVDLPKPYATPSVDNGSKIIERPSDAVLRVPPGFEIKLWAKGLENPRIIHTAPNGDVFVVESIPNRVRLLRDTKGAGKADFETVFVDNLNQPFGLAFYPPKDPQYIYIANTNSVIRFPYHPGDIHPQSKGETLINDLPGGGYHQHWTRNLLFSPDGKKLYVSVGSESNVGEEPEKRAAILEYNPDGTGYRVFANGIRNPVGLAWHPATGELWTACNERDGLGDELAPDYMTAVKDGGFYGWPYYYAGGGHDPRMPEKPELQKKTLLPDLLFLSHSAALGILFNTADQFPAQYKNSLFVALHGSWNRTKKVGYTIARMLTDSDGKPTGSYEDFVSGWLLPDGRVWGRPVALTLAKDGSMLITDDAAGVIWRLSYTGK